MSFLRQIANRHHVFGRVLLNGISPKSAGVLSNPCLLSGVKRTCLFAAHMSAYHP